MPAPGRKPKPEDQRRNRSRPVHDWVEVLDAPYEGPTPNIGRLPARTKAWWATISRMPHCVIWTEADWLFAVETAHVHAEWVRSKKSSLVAEMRLREVRLGVTWDARRDLRIRYVSGVVEAEDPEPVSLDERRRELQG